MKVSGGWPEGTDDLLDAILTDAHGDDEQLWALRQAFEDAVQMPADAFVVGEPVSVVKIDYDGKTRRGLTARCLRDDGSDHVVAVSDVAFPESSEGARHVAACRMWMGIGPLPAPNTGRATRRKHHKASTDDIDPSAPVELIVLAPKQHAARCRVLGTERQVTLRSRDVRRTVPGEILTVWSHNQWQHRGHPYLSGDVRAQRLEVEALGLVPLRLQDEWPWDPAEEYWGEEGEPLEDWANPIVARGPRPSFEMEQALPGEDLDALDDGLILEAIDRHDGGDRRGAEKILLDMLTADLRCLDAHAHLGNFAFERRPEDALRHYEVGVRIGELSLGTGFEGLLPWGRIDNRPFLRCMHGFGICLWRLGRVEEAASTFERMLWMNPTDNQGVRFLLHEVRAGDRWEDRQREE